MRYYALDTNNTLLIKCGKCEQFYPKSGFWFIKSTKFLYPICLNCSRMSGKKQVVPAVEPVRMMGFYAENVDRVADKVSQKLKEEQGNEA